MITSYIFYEHFQGEGCTNEGTRAQVDFCKKRPMNFFPRGEKLYSSSTILFHFLHRVGVKFGRKISELWISKKCNYRCKNFLDEKFSPVHETNSFSRDSPNSKGINLFISDCVEEGRRMYEKGRRNNFSSFPCFHTFLYSQSLLSTYIPYHPFTVLHPLLSDSRSSTTTATTTARRFQVSSATRGRRLSSDDQSFPLVYCYD